MYLFLISVNMPSRNSVTTASNDWVTAKNKSERMPKEVTVAGFKAISRYRPGGTEKTTKHLSQPTQSLALHYGHTSLNIILQISLCLVITIEVTRYVVSHWTLVDKS